MSNKSGFLGKHVLLELYGCPSNDLDDDKYIEFSMIQAAIMAGATVVTRAFHRFSPQGVTGVVVLQESHISIHTWPEKGYAAIDCYTCGDHCSPEKAAEVMIANLKADQHSITILNRGDEEEIRMYPGKQVAAA